MAASHCALLLGAIDRADEPAPERAFDVASPATTTPPSPTAGELAQLNALLADRDFTGAEQFLEELRARTSGAQQQWVDAKLREVRRVLEYNHFVDEYNRAVSLYNSGQYPAAIAVLEELLSGLDEGPDAIAARELLEDARQAQDE